MASKNLLSQWHRLFLLVIVLFAATNQAAPLSLPSWLEPIVPQKGASLADELKCYSLPYGGIGFLSHFLTYWTIFWLGHNKKPYWPFLDLSVGPLDFLLSAGSLLITVPIAGFTISKCRQRWEFVLIAIWKMVMSLEVGIWSLSASYKAMADKRGDYADPIWSIDDWTPWTLIFYVAGMIVGMTGLVAIVKDTIRDNPVVLQITLAFGGTIGLIVLPVVVAITAVVIACAFYSDWILGAIGGNLDGVPSGDNVYLYWAYFAAKRLPMFLT